MIAVHAQPRASRTAVTGLYDGRLKVALRAPPVDGKANEALLRYLAERLGVSKGDISVVSGAAGRRKRVLVSDITLEEALLRLEVNEGG
ncbi:MAG: DUF167 domain-containing protein [Myxococcota bacterium]